MELVGCTQFKQHQHARAEWVDAELERGPQGRDSSWTESLAVGSEHFVEHIKQELGMKGHHREVSKSGEVHMLREAAIAYRSDFGPGNVVFWEQT